MDFSNVPAGYVLVPKIPTDEMIKAGIIALRIEQRIGAKEVVMLAYLAMLHAAKDRR